jgi:PadR family transcriptional regulator, regulatory protein PadR
VKSNDLLQGTLDLLVLRILRRGQMHGWGIADRISEISKTVLSVGEGSLYPALYRLEQKGWVSSAWGVSENKRKAKYYQLTPSGSKQLQVEQQTWDRVVFAISEILRLG